MPNASIAVPDSFVGFTSLVIVLLNAVPACSPLIPAFAIKPIATAVSSILYPIAPAIGATYLNVAPINETFVLLRELASAKTSEKCSALLTSTLYPFFKTFVVPSAASPNAVIASVTISDTVPKSSPLAAARFITPEILFNISFVFQTAIAIYLKASALSVALNFVLAPISIALSLNCVNCVPVAPLIAFTSDIALSNELATFTAAVPTPNNGNVTPFASPLPTVFRALENPLNFCSAVALLSPNTFKSL